MPKLGDAVLYTPTHGKSRVWAAIVTRVNSDGSLELCCFSVKKTIEWLSGVKVTGSEAGSEEARGCWSSR